MYAFSTALSALRAHEEAVDVVGNNLANLNTSGYKSSGVAFSDLVSQTLGAGSTQIGMGVHHPTTVREFSQGPVQSSGRLLDAAIQGSGFFVSRDSNGKTVYSRVGSFKLAADGTLVTQSGDAALGWKAVDGVVDVSKTAGELTVSVGSLLPPKTTANIAMDLNLNSKAAADATSSFPAPIEVVDSLGQTHVLTVTFTKDDLGSWTYAVSIPASELDDDGKVEVGDPAGATGTLTFDENGKLDTSAFTGPISEKISITGLKNGAADMTIDWSLVDASGVPTITQLVADSSVSGISQDGYQASELTQVSIADGGVIVAEYSNGRQQVVGALAIANIRNPETLLAIGGNSYQATAATADPAIGTSGTGGRGEIVGGALEGSNVDMAREFTNLIVYQRGYQANAKVISAADEISQQTINLIR
jgi:flagellar hook protein FlgE